MPDDGAPGPRWEGERTGPRPALYARHRQTVEGAGLDPPRAPLPLALGALACALLVAAGSLGPWEHVQERGEATQTLYGGRTDGLLSLAAALVAVGALGVVLARPGADTAAKVALAALGAATLVGAIDWVFFRQSADTFEGMRPGARMDAGWGLVTVALTGAVGSLLAYLLVRRLSVF